MNTTADAFSAAGVAVFGVLYNGHLRLSWTFLSLSIFCLVGKPIFRNLVTIKPRQALGMLTEVVHQSIGLNPEYELRVTLMSVETKRKQVSLVQVARYDGTNTTPGKTKISEHQGVAGRAYRETKVVMADFPEEDFVNHMIVQWGFTKVEAQRFQVRGAFLCVPIVVANDEVIAVLCLDAKPSGAFTPQHAKIAEGLTPYFSRMLTQPGREV